MALKPDQITRLAILELNALALTRVLPASLEKAKITDAGTPVYDPNGTLLFHRVPIMRGRTSIGYADISAQEALGEPLLAVSTGQAWNEKAIVREATTAARRIQRALVFDDIRFVAYSFPKIAVQFLNRGEEVLLLEWRTWAAVPPAVRSARNPMEPSNFERWSLLDEMPAADKRKKTTEFKKRLEVWASPVLREINTDLITEATFKLPGVLLPLVETREVRYSARTADHAPCYELRGQQTGVWCVAASTEMLLNFYRYHYDQVRLAQELGLGTCDHPNGLPYSQVNKVVTVIEKLTSNTLDATLIANPGWTTFRDEIRANRPLISFIPGHSRTVAGYTSHRLALPGELPFKGLLVYDPWPPTTCALPEEGGVITRWENFATQTYQYAYSAVLKHV